MIDPIIETTNPTFKNIRITSKTDMIHYYGAEFCIGGFFMISNNLFKQLNGYSNNFWKWGYEDTDLANRLDLKKINIDRTQFISRPNKERIRDDISGNLVDNAVVNKRLMEKFLTKYKNNITSIHQDGLSTINYNIIKKTYYKNKKNMIRIKVMIW